MTATERLRALLDARGVEWGRLVDSYGIIGTFWWDSNNDQCSALEGADDIPIGKLSVQANLTPEQAIEATLGRGTCGMEESWHGTTDVYEYRCTSCDEYAHIEVVKPDGAQPPRYCPNCGRKVVNEQ